ncbi:alpha/beta-hydrolase [Polychaeton citri CBS 116435]|uniref:Alpha/beta-hydrolase n=1 Tax=Polychaeton citri CBS 116435 TaxID=1314669 RepID=A0A9P4UNU7_9PEZI|nr:alpha/beta-hydrolase [Polychaeton citri CBS 116435]
MLFLPLVSLLPLVTTTGAETAPAYTSTFKDEILGVGQKIQQLFQTSNDLASAPRLQTRNGTYNGVYSHMHDQDLFLGVPYAQPPIEDLRWRPPQNLNTSFSGTKDATKYGSNCIGLGWDSWGYALSEDCLYLNIIRPHKHSSLSDEPLPIAVWLHGGGFYMGGSADKRFNMSYIVENGQKAGTPFIAISLNYRLNGFGFLYSNEVRGEGGTNLGLRDQRLALQWIQENANLFGGDSSRVTLWGQSCGGNSVGFHMVAYGGRDDGLFSAGVMQSGNPAAWRALNGTEFYQPLYDNVTAHTCSAATDTLACLRTGRVDELVAVFNSSRDTSQKWFPVIDGDFLKELPSRQLNKGNFVKVPIISGTTTNEVSVLLTIDLETDPQVFTGRPYQLGLPRKLADQLFEAYYPGICPDTADGNCTSFESPRTEGMGIEFMRASTFAGDVVFTAARRQTCEALARFGMPAYCYRFDAIPNGQQAPTHFHEVAFVLDNTDNLGYHWPISSHTPPFLNTPPSYSKLANFISRSWVSFFVSHDPNAWRRQDRWDGHEPEWPLYDNQDPYNLVLKPGESHIEPDTWRAAQIKLINDNAHIFQR